MDKVNSLNKLNRDELQYLSTFLDYKSFLNFSLSCKKIFNNLYVKNEVWIKRIEYDFPVFRCSIIQNSKENYFTLCRLERDKNKHKLKERLSELYSLHKAIRKYDKISEIDFYIGELIDRNASYKHKEGKIYYADLLFKLLSLNPCRFDTDTFKNAVYKKIKEFKKDANASLLIKKYENLEYFFLLFDCPVYLFL